MQSKHRIDGSFYPVQRNELLKMRKLKIINNTAFVYLALKYENPFCDRPVEIQVAEFCIKWGLPESSLYAALAVLKNREAISICNRVVTIQWAETIENSSIHSQQAPPSRNLESILGSENGFSDPRMDIYIDRARPDSSDFSDSPLPPRGELEEGGKSSLNLESEATLNHLSSLQDLSNESKEAIAMNGKGLSAAGVEFHQDDIRVSTLNGAVTFHQKHVTVETFPVELEKIPRSLLEEAKDLGVTFDNEVIAAIKEHHQSQLMGALKEMQEYTGRIKHPNKFLLKKLPKMPKEHLGLLMPLYTSNWLDAPADPLPQDIREKTWEKLRANSAKNKARKA